MTVRNPIFCVSFPRSGCAFLAESLQAVLGPELRYSKRYPDDFTDMTNMVKTHDFSLSECAPAGWRTIVQVRHPMDAIASWWNLQLDGGVSREFDTPEHWRPWSLNAIRFYARWVRKWVTSSRVDLVIRLRDLHADPSTHISLVLGIMAGDEEHIPVVEVATPPIPPRPPSSWTTFQHYDPDWEAKLWLACGNAEKLLGYERRGA